MVLKVPESVAVSEGMHGNLQVFPHPITQLLLRPLVEVVPRCSGEAKLTAQPRGMR